jgi:hypothetical protein
LPDPHPTRPNHAFRRWVHRHRLSSTGRRPPRHVGNCLGSSTLSCEPLTRAHPPATNYLPLQEGPESPTRTHLLGPGCNSILPKISHSFAGHAHFHPLTGGQAPRPPHFRSSGAARQDRAQPALPLRQQPETQALPHANSLISKAKWVRLSRIAARNAAPNAQSRTLRTTTSHQPPTTSHAARRAASAPRR